MMGWTCRVCGQHEPLWIGGATERCLHDDGTQPCRPAMDRARAEAARRRVCPDAFDADGKILRGNGHLVRVIRAMEEAGLHMGTGLPLEQPNRRFEA